MKKMMMKTAGVTYLFGACMLLFGANGEAYIDPSILSYVLQTAAAVAITLGMAVGLYWRKAKKKINDKLGINENSKKEVESDDIV